MSLARNYGNAIVESPFGVGVAQGTAVVAKFKPDAIANGRQAEPLIPYLAKELGLEVQAQRNAAQVSALTTPDVWLTGYNTKMTEILAKLGGDLKNRTTTYAQVYPMDQAIALAQRDISVIFEMDRRQLDIEYPGSELLFKQAEVKSFTNYNATGGAALLDTVEKEGKPDKAAYKRYKAKKKAKRSTKA